MSTPSTKVAKTDRRTRKQARELSISSPNLSLKLRKGLRKHYNKSSSLERRLKSVFSKHEIPTDKQNSLTTQISKLLSRVIKLRWTAREHADRRRSTTRTKSINGILKTISRIESRLQSAEFDKFPDDYFANEAGRDLKQERLQALHLLRNSLMPIKGKVGQRNELKRHLAINLHRIFTSSGVKCKKATSYSSFEETFQTCCKHLRLRLTDNVWHYLRRG